MNDTATAGGATGASLLPDTINAFTIAHLAVVAIFALAVIAAIVWGVRLKAARKAAERTIADHNAEMGSTTPAVEREVPRAHAPSAPVPASEPEPAPAKTPAPAQVPTDTAAPEPVPAPVAPVAPAAVPTPPADRGTSPADAPIATLKGLGPKLNTRLGELGITTVGQMAALNDDDAARLDAQLGPFAGRMARDRWIEQARFLAAGDQAGFEAVFGRL